MRVLRVVSDMTGNARKTGSKPKKVLTTRWCDIFIFSNTPYTDEKRWLHTRNDAFNLILKSDFDFTQRKKKKKISFHSLLFSTLKYDFFKTFPVTGQVLNYPQYTHKTFFYNMQKTVWLYLKSVACKVVLRFWHSKKSYLKVNFWNRFFYIWKFEKFCVRLEKFNHCLFYIFFNVSALNWTFRIWFRFLQFHHPGNKRIRCPYKVFSWDWKQT